MEEQDLLHKISVESNINIELLKDLYHSDQFITMIKSKKTMDAIYHIRKLQTRVDLWEAKKAVEMFTEALS